MFTKERLTSYLREEFDEACIQSQMDRLLPVVNFLESIPIDTLAEVMKWRLPLSGYDETEAAVIKHAAQRVYIARASTRRLVFLSYDSVGTSWHTRALDQLEKNGFSMLDAYDLECVAPSTVMRAELSRIAEGSFLSPEFWDRFITPQLPLLMEQRKAFHELLSQWGPAFRDGDVSAYKKVLKMLEGMDCNNTNAHLKLQTMRYYASRGMQQVNKLDASTNLEWLSAVFHTREDCIIGYLFNNIKPGDRHQIERQEKMLEALIAKEPDRSHVAIFNDENTKMYSRRLKEFALMHTTDPACLRDMAYYIIKHAAYSGELNVPVDIDFLIHIIKKIGSENPRAFVEDVINNGLSNMAEDKIIAERERISNMCSRDGVDRWERSISLLKWTHERMIPQMQHAMFSTKVFHNLTRRLGIGIGISQSTAATRAGRRANKGTNFGL